MKAISSHLTGRDAIRELNLDLNTRPGRTVMTALGTLVGIATLVSTLGLAASMTSQVQARFDALTQTEVTAVGVRSGEETGDALPDDGPERARTIAGVRAAALVVELKSTIVAGSPGYDPNAGEAQVPVLAASPGIFKVAHATIRGSSFETLQDSRRYPIALLGKSAAEQLRVFDISSQPVVFVAGKPVVVVGIIEAVERRPILLQAVVLPRGFASTIGPLPAGQLVVDTEIGAAASVGDQLPLALRPDDPGVVDVRVPQSPDTTRRLISSDAQGLLLVLATCSLLIGGVGIANSTLVSVMERVPEIGLRRALGAGRRHIVAHFLLSSTATGLGGGLGGLAIGLIVTAGTALALGWPPTLEVWVAAVAPPLGAAIGLVAGVYPALRASRIAPIAALRAGTS